MQVRGPEGEQEVRDEKGNLVKGGNSVTFRGYRQYVRELLAEAGVIDPEVEAKVDEWRETDRKMARLERFFGMNA